VSDPNCVFCKIIDGVIPSERVYEDEHVIAIRDIQPQAKQHFLVIPKDHVRSVYDAFESEDAGREVVANLFVAAAKIAKKEGLMPDGYRSVFNTNEFGGQTVFHMHLHLLGGERLKGSFA
jgi:histidine triad (HIT) family protein